jgi:hypothetical protein
MSAVVFHERLSGWIDFDELSYNQALARGRELGNSCSQELTIRVEDIEAFLADPDHAASAEGVVFCDALGGELAVERGWFNLFVIEQSALHRRVLYRLFLRDGAGRPLTLSGFKDILHGPNFDVWEQTSRLLVRILRGHVAEDPDGDELTIATGILHISRLGLMRMITTFRGGLRSLAEFDRFFVKSLVRDFGYRSRQPNDADWPSPSGLDPCWQGHPPGDWHELVGRAGLKRRIVGFSTADGRFGTLHNIRREPDRMPGRGPVLLLHGSSVRANIFYGAPTRSTLVDALVAAGYDVWAENWRASIDLPPSEWTLEEAAVYDHPAAVSKIIAETQHPTLKAVVHCQGSTSFMMAAVAGLVPEVTTVVSNAVSLHVNLTRRSKLKVSTMIPPLSLVLRGVDPQWAVRPPAGINRAVATWATLGRRHCDSDICRFSNYAYGLGPDVLWHHVNLNRDTHEWGSREWGFCPFSFFRQMGRSARAGHLVASKQLPGLPESFIDGKPQTDARFTFIAGDQNTCFLPLSQQRTYNYFDGLEPGRHALHLLPGYTHLDVFLGKEAHHDVYPLIVSALG